MSARLLFGSQMRRLRETAGLTRVQLAERTAYKSASIRSFETGHRTPTPALAAALERIFDAKGLLAAIQVEAEQETTPFGELRENEQRATAIRIWDPRVVPGLLQHEDYALAILGTDELVDERMDRQGIFTRDEPPQIWVIICESVLRKQIGGPRVLRRQLEYLIREDAPWTLQVMPESVGLHDGLSGPLILLEFADESPIAFVDGRTGGTVVDDPARVAEQWKDWERMVGDALSPAASREMIAGAIAALSED